jgi:hypothetical protein
MKKLIAILLTAICWQVSMAQDDDPVYLLFEFMQVDNEQEAAYAETENFWEKIHQQSVQNGDKVGWDLWVLQPGGEIQNFQYLTVNVYNDPVKMYEGGSLESLMANAKKAYPNMSEDQILEKLNNSSKTRDLAVRVYLSLDETTDGDYEMAVGSISRINMMKSKAGANPIKIEREVFKPQHQKMVDAGQRGSWGLASVMLPYGTEVYADYYTFDMYKDYAQMIGEFNYQGAQPTEEQQNAFQEIATMRDLKFSYIGKLLKKVR